MTDKLLTRRNVLAGFAATLSTSLQTPHAAASGNWTFPTIVDVAFDTRPILQELRRRGVTTIFRYYAYRDDQWEGKLVVPDEAKAIHDAGMSLGVVYQYHNNVLQNLTARRGRIDAEHALEFGSQSIGQPSGSAVYFGVDGDWPATSAMTRIREYFEAINEVFSTSGAHWTVGVYGSGKTCEFLRTRNLASLFWLPRSTGWTGVTDFYNAGRWTMYQNAQSVKINRIELDTNWVNPAFDSVGGFDRSRPTTADQPQTVLEQRRFILRTTALRRNAGGGGTISTLSKRRNVAELDRADGWVSVDINEDGVSDGYCAAADLGPVSRMP